MASRPPAAGPPGRAGPEIGRALRRVRQTETRRSPGERQAGEAIHAELQSTGAMVELDGKGNVCNVVADDRCPPHQVHGAVANVGGPPGNYATNGPADGR